MLLFIEVRFWNEKHDGDGFNLLLHFSEKPWHTAYAASEAAEDEETVTLKWANANWSKAAKVKVFFLDADRKPVAEAVTALIKGQKSEKLSGYSTRMEKGSGIGKARALPFSAFLTFSENTC